MKDVIKRFLVVIDWILQSIYFLINNTSESKQMEIEYSDGDPGDCGIAAVDMLIKYLGGDLDPNWAELKTEGNYIVDVGWKHYGLKNIIEDNSNEKVEVFSNKSYLYIIKKLTEGNPVIVSIKVPSIDDLDHKDLYKSVSNTDTFENHMVLVSGYDKNTITIQDPRNLGIYSANIIVTNKVFQSIFNGNGIAIT